MWALSILTVPLVMLLQSSVLMLLWLLSVGGISGVCGGGCGADGGDCGGARGVAGGAVMLRLLSALALLRWVISAF